MGVGMAFIWSPLAATATRNLPRRLAGAGSGVYNATRQVGGVLGSAGMAAFMTSRISAEMPGGGQRPAVGEGSVTQLPAFLHEPFSAALSQALLLPAFVALFGVVAALFLRGFGDGSAGAAESTTAPTNGIVRRADRNPTTSPTTTTTSSTRSTGTIRSAGPRRVRSRPPRRRRCLGADESDTEPLCASTSSIRCTRLPRPGTAVRSRRGTACCGRTAGRPTTRTTRAGADRGRRTPSRPRRSPTPSRNGDRRGAASSTICSTTCRAPPTGLASRSDSPTTAFTSTTSTHLQVPPPVAEPARRDGTPASRTDDDAGTYGRHSMRFRD